MGWETTHLTSALYGFAHLPQFGSSADITQPHTVYLGEVLSGAHARALFLHSELCLK